MSAKDYQGAAGSPKVEVGEIDTRAPFQSVKDAVNLFGEGAFSGGKTAIRKAKSHSAEKVLAKETQLHLAQKELSKLKEQLKNAEITKAQALVDLVKSKRTVDDLTQKLNIVGESKESVIKATEASRDLVKQLREANCGNPVGTDGDWKQDLESSRKHYMSAIAELDTAKQELRQIHQDYDASMEAKVAAFKQAAEAEQEAKVNMERAGELSKEITTVQESIGQVKLATEQAQQKQAKIYAEKNVQKQSYKTTLEESAKKLIALKKEFDPELSKNIEAQLAETVTEIGALKKDVENTKASDLDSLKIVTEELDYAKESLHKVAEGEGSLRSLMESLKLELENVKKEHSELKEKEAETESIVGNLHVKLRKSKSELEAALSEESRVRVASEEMISAFHQLSSESENAKHEAEEMKKKAEELKEESEATRIVLEEAENKLKIALEEAEEAKAAEARALDQIKILSERTDAARASTSEFGAQITISREEFESLSRKVEESDKLAEMKVAAAMAQVEAVKASENEAHKRLEGTQKEIDEMKAAAKDAVKRAEMAEAAKKAVEGELQRWREREQKKAAEVASRILAETESSQSSPHNYLIQKHNPSEIIGVRKLEKEKHPALKKVFLANLSVIFHRKKNLVEGGSPSYMPV
ncbi:WEB family protein At5g55860-like [Cornus florida]|uniref:WEB family protein At5g55860-like n=1 Tax=Cornus florida TaxID=4283 RepID=UPI0028965D61|nr:WEB family protein At5g55860-like [Cornus florida]